MKCLKIGAERIRGSTKNVLIIDSIVYVIYQVKLANIQWFQLLNCKNVMLYSL